MQISTPVLQELARSHALSWKKTGGIVIGITGSAGKTTVKEILALIASKVFGKEKICATLKNFNNLIGVPLTILQLRKEHKLAFVELGISEKNEMNRLCEIAQPDHGIILNTGDSHLEFLKNRETVFNEKKGLYNYIEKQKGLFLINKDDQYLKKLSYGATVSSRDTKADYFFQQDKNEINVKGKRNFHFKKVKIKEDYNQKNLLFSALLLLEIFPDEEAAILRECINLELLLENRSRWKKFLEKDIFLDAYNANPTSMKASLKYYLSSCDDLSRSLFILGDMNELGTGAEKYHEEIARWLFSEGVKNIIFVGSYAKSYLKGFPNAKTYSDVEELRRHFKEISSSFKEIFIKGSRSVFLERLVQ